MFIRDKNKTDVEDEDIFQLRVIYIEKYRDDEPSGNYIEIAGLEKIKEVVEHSTGKNQYEEGQYEEFYTNLITSLGFYLSKTFSRVPNLDFSNNTSKAYFEEMHKNSFEIHFNQNMLFIDLYLEGITLIEEKISATICHLIQMFKNEEYDTSQDGWSVDHIGVDIEFNS